MAGQLIGYDIGWTVQDEYEEQVNFFKKSVRISANYKHFLIFYMIINAKNEQNTNELYII